MASGDKVSNGVIINPAPHARPRAHMSSTIVGVGLSVLFSYKYITPKQQERHHFDGSTLPHPSGGPKGAPRPPCDAGWRARQAPAAVPPVRVRRGGSASPAPPTKERKRPYEAPPQNGFSP